MEDCIFCKIVEGQLPCYKIYEDGDILAFLDINPSAPGHTLVIPKKHVADIFDMDEETFKKIAAAGRKIALKMKEKLGVAGVNFYQASGTAAEQTVFHAHLHVIPRKAGDNICFDCAAPRKEKMSGADFEEISAKLKIEE
jgi:histidine triad (HIT) family protein